jgi:hypothetical protein
MPSAKKSSTLLKNRAQPSSSTRATPAGFKATSREDKDGRKVYTKGDKDYVKRQTPDGTFGMRQVSHKMRERTIDLREFNSTYPSMIFLIGPTGSGKTGLRVKTLEHYNITHPKEDVPHIGIDEFVENDPEYKEAVLHLMKNKQIKHLDEPSESLLKDFKNAYFASREKGCKHQIEEGGCDEVNDNLLHKTIKNGTSMTIEITGVNNFKWFVAQIPENKTYNIILSVALAPLPTLVQRNKTRASSAFTEFKNNDGTTSAPRLPDINETRFREVLATISRNVVKMIVDCFLNNKVPDFCGTRYMTEICLWDTSTKPIKQVGWLSNRLSMLLDYE